MNGIAIKRTLRELKKLEIKLRSGLKGEKNAPLVWDVFFDLRDTGKAKHSLDSLAAMSRLDYKKVIGEYWSFVFKSLVDEGDFHGVRFEPGVLLKWGLPYNADEAAVKQRFRTLAKRHHPDTGGNAEDFIELMRDYRKIVGKEARKETLE